jgi:hypothetical protein
LDKFLALTAGIQEEKIPEIRRNLEMNGFVLSIDGTAIPVIVVNACSKKATGSYFRKDYI